MERIGKYEIRRPLGAGATSSVHLAWDPFAGREVAIKRIHPEILRDPRRGHVYRHLLMNEAALAGKLVHPHIVGTFDAHVDDEDAWIVMEYVGGGTLADFCTPEALLPFDRLIEIIFKCTRALDYAFRRGITHRDIKPANILLTDRDGQDIKISDFGSAFDAGSDATQIASVGSPSYMSPQQVRQLPLDQQTDIYSLGVVMYQLLTGRLPFEADNQFSLLYSIAHDEAPAPASLRPDIPDTLDAIVRRAIDRDLDRRYRDWPDFAHDLACAFRNRAAASIHSPIPDAEKFQTLRRLTFFRNFSDVELWEVIGLAHWSRVQPGTVVIREGEPGDHFCFLATGEARVRKRGRLLNLLGEGECFGEMSLFAAGGSVRSASVEATTALETIRIDAQALHRASDATRMHFYQGFLEVLASRLSLANSRLAGV
ncbi:serine/threonine-protein kinase [Azoarcus sp. DN11]|uniref:serine/threonine-protein kinase n=1 Tax=Azoarcus sp. DN11 TaxID=356837 RepID=UPI000EAF2DA6|nr:serine/threonine-protein kinase [Azoarcus sp. DN11]AYH42736.1 serine/threonine protein kinase [Azoarcus sp. DN11]